jgi:fumarate hydratase class II
VLGVSQHPVRAVGALHDAIATTAEAWKDIVKIGRTHCRMRHGPH